MTDCPIYDINLDRSPGRLIEITHQLENFELCFERIQAIYEKIVSDEQKAFLNKKVYQFKHSKLSLPGELGRYPPHNSLIDIFLPSKKLYVFILETGIKHWPAYQYRLKT